MDEINYMKFTVGEKMTMLRKQEGKTLEEVAVYLKMSVEAYMRLEEDFTYPSDLQIATVGRFYGLRYDQVVGFGEG